MKAKKTLFSRATALFTAAALFLTGIMGYTFAVSDGDGAAAAAETGGGKPATELTKSNVTAFYVTIEDNKGNTATAGWGENVGYGDYQINAEDVTSVSLTFEWMAMGLDSDELTQNGGLLKFYVGDMHGIKITGKGSSEDNPAVTANANYNAAYWMDEDGYLYVRLDADAYNRFVYSGSFTFTCDYEIDELVENDNNGRQLEVENGIIYHFATPSDPPEPDFFVNKSAVGNVYYEAGTDGGDEGGYYQDFVVYLGSINGQIENVVLTDELGEWLEIDTDSIEVYLGDQKIEEGNGYTINKDPFSITFNATPDSTGTWWQDNSNAYMIKYRVKLKVGSDKLSEFNSYTDEGKSVGLNTIEAKSGDKTKTDNDYIKVATPSVNKTGYLTKENGETVIKWRITVKPTDLSGDTFKLSDKFKNNSEYLDLTEFYTYFDRTTGELTEEGKRNLHENPATGEYYIDFTTKVIKRDTHSVTIENEATADFGDDEKFTGDASVSLPADGTYGKTLLEYELYDPEEGITTNTFVWQIDYTVPGDLLKQTDTGEYEIDYGKYQKGFFIWDDHYYAQSANYGKYRDNVEIDCNSFVIVGDGGGRLEYDENETETKIEIELKDSAPSEFGLYIKDINFLKQNLGKTIHIQYTSRINVDEAVSYIKNSVYDGGTLKGEVEEDFTSTLKDVIGSNDPDEDYAAEWTVYVKSDNGFYRKDQIVVTDTIPEGMEIDASSVQVGYVTTWYNAAPAPGQSLTQFYVPKHYHDDWNDYDYDDKATNEDLKLSCKKYKDDNVYRISFTIPEDCTAVDEFSGIPTNGSTIYVAVRYTTKATQEGKEKLLTGEIAAFTNHASAFIVRNGKIRNSTKAEATFVPDLNEDNRYLEKTGTDKKDNKPITVVTDKGEVPAVEYTIKVNPGKETLFYSGYTGDKTLELIDTMGQQIDLVESSVKVVVERRNGEPTTVVPGEKQFWEFDKTLRRLTFYLEDETSYVITYMATVNRPGASDSYNDEEYYNTATLVIGADAITSVEDGKWVERVNPSLRSKDSYVELNITKTWENTAYGHNIKFDLIVEKWNYDTQTRVDEATKTLHYYTKTTSRTADFSIASLPVMEVDASTQPNTTYYFVYKLKEVAVDGKSINGTYTPDFGGGEQEYTVDCYEMVKDLIENTIEANVDIVNPYDITLTNTYTKTEVKTVSLTVKKLWANCETPTDKPEKITVKLTGNNGDTRTVDLKGPSWTVTLDGIEEGAVYEVKEVGVDGKTYTNNSKIVIDGKTYVVTYGDQTVDQATGNITLTVTNTLQEEPKVSLKVTKSWGTGSAPAGAEVTIKLTNKNDTADVKTAELSDEKGWTKTWDNIPKGAVYEVEEVKVVIGNDSYYVVGSTLKIGEDTYTVITPDSQTVDPVTGNISFTVTNTLNAPETISVTVNKVWGEDGNGVKKEGTSVTVQLTENGVLYGTPVDLPENGEWSHTWNGLSKGKTYAVVEVIRDENGEVVKDDEGNVKTYGNGSTIEIDGDKYTVSIAPIDENGNITVTNTVINETKVTVDKSWGTDEWLKEKGPTVTVKLVATDQSGNNLITTDQSGNSYIIDPVKYPVVVNKTLSKNDWHNEWSKLPKYYNDAGVAKEIKYSVVEVVVDEEGNETTHASGQITLNGDTYTVSIAPIDVNGNITVTNTLDNTTSVKVKKNWEPSVPDGAEVTIKLYATTTNDDGTKNTTEAGSVTFTTEGGVWTKTWSDLPKYNDEGKEITYTVEEQGVNGLGRIKVGDDDYQSTSSGSVTSDEGVTITNELIVRVPGKISVIVEKSWGDDEWLKDEGPTVYVKLIGAEDQYPDPVPLPKADGSWTHIWDNLPEEGKYSVVETDENGVPYGETATIGGDKYTVSYSSTDKITGTDGKVTITNTLTNETEVTVTKKWLKGETSEGNKTYEAYKEGSKVTLMLFADDVPQDVVTLTSSDNWTKTWNENLKKYNEIGKTISYTVKEVKEVPKEVAEAEDSKFKPGELKLFKGVYYKVYEADEQIEIDEDEYTVGYPALGADGVITVTNKLVNETEVTVTKDWDNMDESGLSKNDYSVKVGLFNDAGVERDPVTLSKDHWTATWKNLPKYTTEGGQLIEIDYGIKEIEISDVNGKFKTVVENKEFTIDGEDGKHFKFTVEYADPDPSGEKFIKNTYSETTVDPISLEVTKSWLNCDPPEGAIVRVKLKGNDGTEKYGELSSPDWSCEWKELTRGVEYSVEEIEVVIGDDHCLVSDGTTLLIGDDEYTVTNWETPKKEMDETNALGTDNLGTDDKDETDKISAVITNKLNTPDDTPISVTVYKEWGDDDGVRKDGTSVTVQLTENGVLYGEPVDLPKDNGEWFNTWTDLPKDNVYAVVEVIRGENGEVVTDEDGNVITYGDGDTIEIDGDKYKVTCPDTVTGESGEITITNTLINKTGVTVEKKWSKDSLYDNGPEVTVKLVATDHNKNNWFIDAEKYGIELEKPLNSGNKWHNGWEELPKYYDYNGEAKKIVYSVVEVVEGVTYGDGATITLNGDKYTVSIATIDENGNITVTNTLKPKDEKPETPTVPDDKPGNTPTPKPSVTTKVEETTTEETTTEETTAEETTVEETTVEVTTVVPVIPEYYPPVTSDDNFNMFDDGNPRGDMNIPTEDDNFNMFDDGNPRGNMNMPTGVVVGGGVLGLAAGSLIVAAVAQAIGKRKGGKKNK